MTDPMDPRYAWACAMRARQLSRRTLHWLMSESREEPPVVWLWGMLYVVAMIAHELRVKDDLVHFDLDLCLRNVAGRPLIEPDQLRRNQPENDTSPEDEGA